MSYEYDRYLEKHKANVKSAFKWLQSNCPALLDESQDLEWQICFAHDQSKTNQDEYLAYDAYFYGNNRSYYVVKEYQKAWLLHIHRNPHHWQYWVLINDDPKEGEVLIEMPYNYILEMICDWWSFSWNQGDLMEVFNWYNEHKDYMKLNSNTRKEVEEILGKIKEKLETDSTLLHHGIKGQKWGVKNGPPYPLEKSSKRGIIEDAIASGEVSKQINAEKQMRHTKTHHVEGRSYLDGDLDYAQELVDMLSGTGEAVYAKPDKWLHKEKVTASNIIGTHVDENGNETKTAAGMIVYSKTGTHIYPRKDEKNET